VHLGRIERRDGRFLRVEFPLGKDGADCLGIDDTERFADAFERTPNAACGS
jgi:hypothetical protein